MTTLFGKHSAHLSCLRVTCVLVQPSHVTRISSLHPTAQPDSGKDWDSVKRRGFVGEAEGRQNRRRYKDQVRTAQHVVLFSFGAKKTLFICLSYVICHTIATLVHGTSVETRNRGRLHNSALLNGFSVALSKTGFSLLQHSGSSDCGLHYSSPKRSS